MRVRPKKVRRRRLTGRASLDTQSSRTFEGLQGGGTVVWDWVEEAVAVAAAYARERMDGGRPASLPIPKSEAMIALGNALRIVMVTVVVRKGEIQVHMGEVESAKSGRGALKGKVLGQQA